MQLIVAIDWRGISDMACKNGGYSDGSAYYRILYGYQLKLQIG